MTLPSLYQEANSMESQEPIEELEYIFFLKLEDFEQLKKAKSKESQEQWSVLFREERELLETSVRVRRSVVDASETFTLTSKINIAGIDGKWELEQNVDRFHFDEMKRVAKEGLSKERHFFPVDGTSLVWEVDVFYDSNGDPVEWVKLDLEVPQRLERLPEFPLEHTDSMVTQFEERSEDQHQWVRDLFDRHYTIVP